MTPTDLPGQTKDGIWIVPVSQRPHGWNTMGFCEPQYSRPRTKLDERPGLAGILQKLQALEVGGTITIPVPEDLHWFDYLSSVVAAVDASDRMSGSDFQIERVNDRVISAKRLTLPKRRGGIGATILDPYIQTLKAGTPVTVTVPPDEKPTVYKRSIEAILTNHPSLAKKHWFVLRDGMTIHIRARREHAVQAKRKAEPAPVKAVHPAVLPSEQRPAAPTCKPDLHVEPEAPDPDNGVPEPDDDEINPAGVVAIEQTLSGPTAVFPTSMEGENQEVRLLPEQHPELEAIIRHITAAAEAGNGTAVLERATALTAQLPEIRAYRKARPIAEALILGWIDEHGFSVDGLGESGAAACDLAWRVCQALMEVR